MINFPDRARRQSEARSKTEFTSCQVMDSALVRCPFCSSVGSPGRNRSSISSTSAAASRELGGNPVTTGRKRSHPSACSSRSVAARTIAVRGTLRSSAISPNPSPGRVSSPGAVSDDVGRARLDDIEAVSWITLAKYGLAGGHMDRFQTAGKLFNSGQRQRLKHGHPVEQPDFLVQFSDVAVEVSQATPCHHHEAWTKRADDHQCNGDARPFDQERNESAQPNAEGDQALEQAEYAGEDLIGANLAINVNKPTSTSALPIPTHARR